MKNMACYTCVLKHLAASIAYAKEVADAHGMGRELDHRADLLGEIVSAEHHLQALADGPVKLYVNEIRKKLEDNRYTPDEDIIQRLRQSWSMVERSSKVTVVENKTVPPLHSTAKSGCGCGKTHKAPNP